jgi:hypothetical protein
MTQVMVFVFTFAVGGGGGKVVNFPNWALVCLQEIAVSRHLFTQLFAEPDG